ncbi:MAG: DUF934 domain-containing protein [Nevskia sp.]|nr:DUF934 domain-containing protein [Nevskia sp.]
MSRILKNRRLVEDDWRLIEDGAPVCAGEKIIVPLRRWREERSALLASAAAVGVLLPNTEDVEALWPEIADRPLIALQFPVFGDGRALSQAVVLRRRLGFGGELRALGDILRDQVFGLQRCGFDAIVPRADQDLEDCLRALAEFSVVYQPAADGLETVWQKRRSATPA